MKDKSFDELLASIRWMGRHMRGETRKGQITRVAEPDIKAIRESARVSQTEFAQLIGVNVRTLQNWEQRRSRPTGAARALLKIVAVDPKAAIKALHS